MGVSEPTEIDQDDQLEGDYSNQGGTGGLTSILVTRRINRSDRDPEGRDGGRGTS